MGCLLCGRGFCVECRKCRKGKCHDKENSTPVAESESGNDEPKPRKDRTAAGLRDPKSTGRKRAARLYPLDANEPCEWRGLKLCGGGRVPVIGCYDGKQEHRHHGPIKNPTRNHAGNVHRICAACHVHWHELNDLVYDEAEFALLPHDPVPATDEEIIKNSLEWKTGEMKKKYTLASSVKGGKVDLSD